MNRKSQGISIFSFFGVVVIIIMVLLTTMLVRIPTTEGPPAARCDYLRPKVINPLSSIISITDTYVIGESVSFTIIFDYNNFTQNNCIIDDIVKINMENKTYQINLSQEREVNISLDTNIGEVEDIKTLEILWSEVYVGGNQSFLENKEFKKSYHIISKLKSDEYKQAEEQINATTENTKSVKVNTKWIKISIIIMILCAIPFSFIIFLIKRKKQLTEKEKRIKFFKDWKIK